MYRSVEIHWVTFPWPWTKITAVALINERCSSARTSKNHPLNHGKTWWLYPSAMLFIWSNSWDQIPGGICSEYFCWYFLFKIWDVCFMIKRSIRHILGRVGAIDMKWKGSVSIGCWANYMWHPTIISPMPLSWIFKVKSCNNCILGIGGLIDVKQNKVNRMHPRPTSWPRSLTKPWPWISNVKFWNSQIPGMGGWIEEELKGRAQIVHGRERLMFTRRSRFPLPQNSQWNLKSMVHWKFCVGCIPL